MLLVRAHRLTVLALGLVVLLTTVLVGVLTAPRTEAAAVDYSGFRPGNIISDAVFFNSASMSEGDIQRFLTQQGTACSGSLCLKNYVSSVPARAASAYCAGYPASGNESAARILDKVAKSCGINPQVLLVILQKEQGLVTRKDPTAARYQKAMGFACPDTKPCDAAYYGFGNQVFSAAHRFKEYADPGSRYSWIKVGQVNQIRFHPNTACGSSPVLIENRATAGLYYYTPYQPNQASLAAGTGEGDACSSYGNRNFYRYFTQWFGASNNPRFIDVPAYHAFASQMTWLADRKITTGYSDGSFRPSEAVLREQMAAFLFRYVYNGLPPGPNRKPSTFLDVPTTHAFTKHIHWLAGTGITTGYDGNTFRPGQPVLREQMAAFLYRLAGRPSVTLPATSPFADVPTTHSFYTEIVWLAGTGVSEGYQEANGSRTFRGSAPVLREQMAAFLKRFDDKGLRAPA